MQSYAVCFVCLSYPLFLIVDLEVPLLPAAGALLPPVAVAADNLLLLLVLVL